MVERITRAKDDRLLRWTAYASAPFAWLSLALLDPLLLLTLPLIYLALSKAMEYGIVERHDPVPGPDDF
ncbi:MAG: hypothetical protein ACRDNB_02175 [Gaiellaceae bacterium]